MRQCDTAEETIVKLNAKFEDRRYERAFQEREKPVDYLDTAYPQKLPNEPVRLDRHYCKQIPEGDSAKEFGPANPASSQQITEKRTNFSFSLQPFPQGKNEKILEKLK